MNETPSSPPPSPTVPQPVLRDTIAAATGMSDPLALEPEAKATPSLHSSKDVSSPGYRVPAPMPVAPPVPAAVASSNDSDNEDVGPASSSRTLSSCGLMSDEIRDGRIFKRISTIAKELNIPKISLLKMDIEGYEWPVFEGFKTEPEALLPKQILVEIHAGLTIPDSPGDKTLLRRPEADRSTLQVPSPPESLVIIPKTEQDQVTAAILPQGGELRDILNKKKEEFERFGVERTKALRLGKVSSIIEDWKRQHLRDTNSVASSELVDGWRQELLEDIGRTGFADIPPLRSDDQDKYTALPHTNHIQAGWTEMHRHSPGRDNHTNVPISEGALILITEDARTTRDSTHYEERTQPG
ncbi:hypothetical protein HKX48_008253 [Thoreauomyces humboldtii]|nr:hypothetical protein HKX48_008253 [Thoreauomyces humboldtii]